MDIDIDFPTDFNPHEFLPWARASMLKDGKLVAHNCGYYPQLIPTDCVTTASAIPFKAAEELGFFKIDFLHLSVYDHFESREQIDALLAEEPDWGILCIPSEQKKLFQLSKHGDILSYVKPKSVEEVADVLALIRPGKKQLLKLYMSQRVATRRILYAKDESGYAFKKSHAIAYSLVIKLQLLLIQTGVI